MMLFVNDDEIPMTNLLVGKPSLRADNGVVGTTYRMTDQILNRIAKAKTVGVAMKPPHNTTIFMGFNGMSFADGAAKLPGFLSVCRR